jgi:RNA polymerase sigma factor (sigma-70 family)
MATAPPSADAVLVRRLHERDRTAWEELYDSYGPRLRPFAYRLTGNRHDADDLVQETFVRALPRLDRLDSETVDIGAYLFTTLRNLFLKSVERGRRVEPTADVPEPATPAPIEDDPERSTMLRRQQEEVRVANAKLDPRQRLVLALRELEDRSYAEIGVVVGLKENAVAQLISRARESLRTELRLAQVDPASLPRECRRFLPLLSRHLDGQLRGAQLETTLEHLDGCERCQDALLSMKEARRRYRVLLPPFFGGDDQRARIDAELTAAGYWKPPRRGAAWRAHRMLVAAAAGLLVAGAGGVGAAVLVSKGEPSAAPVATTTAPAPGTSAANTTRVTVIKTKTKPVLPATTGTPATTKAKPITTTEQTTANAKKPTPTPTPKPKPKPKPKPIVPPLTTAPQATTEHVTTAEIDELAPTVTIVARPPAATQSRSAWVSFRASEPDASFTCKLDGAAFGACSSPASYRELALGPHALAVRARDRVGNVGAAVIVRWTVVATPDVTPPTAKIVSAVESGGGITFRFTSSEAGSTFGCALDGSAFELCTTPRAYAAVAPGSHTFSVRATDAAANTGAAATHSWAVAQPLPDLVITALTETSFVVTNVGTAAAGPFVVSVTLIGAFSFTGLAPNQSASRTWSACRRGTLTTVADRGRIVSESNEDNNTRSLASDC